MPKPISMPMRQPDDEALWFPVSMSGSDSFSRPTTADGASLDDPVTGVDDDIGLPRARKRGGDGGGPRRPPKGGIRASSWLWLTLWGAAAAGIVVYAARRDIAAEIVQGWLAGQGARARVHFDRLTLRHAEGRLLVGPQDRPDFKLERFDIDYVLTPFARGGLPLAQVTRVHLVHPVMQVSLKGGQLDFGSLDGLVQNVLKAPPSNAPPPHDILVEDAIVRLSTDYGWIGGRGGLSLHDGRLAALNLTVPATHLQGRRGEIDLAGAQVLARSVATANGEQLHVQASLSGSRGRLGDAGSLLESAGDDTMRFDEASLSIDALLPYRKSKAFIDAFSGASQARMSLHGGHVSAGGTDFDGLDAQLVLAGALQSGQKAGGFSGAAQLNAQAEAVHSGDMTSQGLRVAGNKLAVKANVAPGKAPVLTLNGPVNGRLDRLHLGGLNATDAFIDLARLSLVSDEKGAQADFDGRTGAARMTDGDVRLTQLRITLGGEGRSDTMTGGWRLMAQGDVEAEGSYDGLDALARGRAPSDSVPALDHALDRFSLKAHALNLDMAAEDAASPAHVKLRLGGDVTADLRGGGLLKVSAPGGTLFDSTGKGALRAMLSGPGLPEATLAVADLIADPQGQVGGDWQLTAKGSVAPLAGAAFDGHGRFATTADGGFAASLDMPATLTSASAELGDHIENLSIRLTPLDAPLLSMDRQGWRSEAGFSDLTFDAPNEQAAFDGGAGRFAAYALPGSDVIGLKAALDAGRVSDALPEGKQRFYPLRLSGLLSQDVHSLSGRFIAATPAQKSSDGKLLPVAQIDLVNGVSDNSGHLNIRTAGLDFTPAGLQPSQLTPMAAAASQVSGRASFEGGFTWDAKTVASGGTLTLDGLDFTAGPATAKTLDGRIIFTSLSPLRSDPQQHLSIASIEAGLPLRDLDIALQFEGDHVALENARVTTPGGEVRLEPMDIPMDGAQDMHGAVAFDGLDFGRIIAATSLADSMSFDGALSGRLPFILDKGHVRISNGTMSSDRPGYISIRRSAVTGVHATGNVTSTNVDPATAAVADAKASAAADASPFNPFQDLAYQALEHIAYDQLDARVNSEGGVLDNSFHIKGRFDPPQKQAAHISLFDYMRGTWLQKPIKLPSDTPVELYLEVPLNLDELLGDLGKVWERPSGTAPSEAQNTPENTH